MGLSILSRKPIKKKKPEIIEIQPEEEVVHVIEKRVNYESNESEEQLKENVLVVPEDNKDDWEEVKASKISNQNNKINGVTSYFIPKDDRKRRGNRGGLLNLSEPESISSVDPVQTRSTANLVQPLVSYYDSFPGIKNYETEIETEADTNSDIMITEKRSMERMDTTNVVGYTYEKQKQSPKLKEEKMGGYVYQSEKKTVEVEVRKSARSFDSDDYYFYKNEYYKRPPSTKEIDFRKEKMESYLYENRKKEVLLKSHRMLNYTYEGPIQEEVDWEVEKRILRKQCK